MAPFSDPPVLEAYAFRFFLQAGTSIRSVGSPNNAANIEYWSTCVASKPATNTNDLLLSF